MADHPRRIIACSGGVDSLLLADVAHQAAPGTTIVAHSVTQAVPRAATDRVRRTADALGWQLRLVESAELSDARYLTNPVDRCFFCKTNLYDELDRIVGELAPDASWTLMSGANVDDLGEYRPGLLAAAEHHVRHPFVEAGIGKDGIRAWPRRGPATGTTCPRHPASPAASTPAPRSPPACCARSRKARSPPATAPGWRCCAAGFAGRKSCSRCRPTPGTSSPPWCSTTCWQRCSSTHPTSARSVSTPSPTPPAAPSSNCLLLSGSPDGGPLLGNLRPTPRPAGRGRLLTRDRGVEALQLAWTDPTL